MGSCGENECCNSSHGQGNSCHDTCHDTCHNQSKEGFEEWLLEAADCAWTEVLKEKIKEHILQTQGDKMAELAKIVSEANGQRWKHKMEKKHHRAELKEKLSNFFKFKK